MTAICLITELMNKMSEKEFPTLYTYVAFYHQKTHIMTDFIPPQRLICVSVSPALTRTTYKKNQFESLSTHLTKRSVE